MSLAPDVAAQGGAVAKSKQLSMSNVITIFSSAAKSSLQSSRMVSSSTDTRMSVETAATDLSNGSSWKRIPKSTVKKNDIKRNVPADDQQPEVGFANKIAGIVFGLLSLFWFLTAALDDIPVFIGATSFLYFLLVVLPAQPSTADRQLIILGDKTLSKRTRDMEEVMKLLRTNRKSKAKLRLKLIKVREVINIAPTSTTNDVFGDLSFSLRKPFRRSSGYVHKHDLLDFMGGMGGMQVMFMENDFETLKHHALQLIPGQIRELLPQTVEDLFAQHGKPTFRITSLYEGFYEEWCKNQLHDPLFTPDDDEISLGTSYPGRPVEHDQLDIEWLFNFVRQYYAPTDMDIKRDADHAVRLRCRKTNKNVVLEALLLQYYKLINPREHIDSLEDIYPSQYARARYRRPECGLGINYGPGSDFGLYLTDAQERALNEGCGDYPGKWDGELHGVEAFEHLRQNPKLQEGPRENPVVEWIESHIEKQFLHPNDFFPCNCGIEAAEALKTYRREPVSDINPAGFYNDEFPPYYTANSALWDTRYNKIRGKEFFEYTFPLRHQTVKQTCDLHETVTNNLFVLLDSFAYDINTRISNPGGRLPAPGHATLTKYPPGLFHIHWGMRMLPKDELAPRCLHGGLHPSKDSDDFCDICFEGGEDCEDCDCVDCWYHKAALAPREVIYVSRGEKIPEAIVASQTDVATGAQLGTCVPQAVAPKVFLPGANSQGPLRISQIRPPPGFDYPDPLVPAAVPQPKPAGTIGLLNFPLPAPPTPRQAMAPVLGIAFPPGFTQPQGLAVGREGGGFLVPYRQC